MNAMTSSQCSGVSNLTPVSAAALLNQVDRNVDVAAGGFGVRTNLVRFVDQSLGDFALDARQADVEASAEEVAAVREVQVHFGVDRDVGRQGDFSFARPQARSHFRSRPTSRRRTVAPDWCRCGRAGSRKLDVEAAVGAARDASRGRRWCGFWPCTGLLTSGSCAILVELAFASQPRSCGATAQVSATSMTASAKACGASCGRLCPMPPVMSRCAYLPENFLA